jgi:hypothetical protein
VRNVKHDIFIILFLILVVKKWCNGFKRANEHYDIVKRGNLMIYDGACLFVKNLPSKLISVPGC